MLICLNACNIKQNQENSTLSALDKYITLKMERDNVPGLSACIIKGDQIVWSKGYGWADVEQKIPLNENSIIGVASISKLITAAAIMQLSEQNKIILSDPVNKYIPFKIQHPVHSDVEITIAQILSHTSSISNGPSLWRSYRCSYETINLEEWARAYFLPEG